MKNEKFENKNKISKNLGHFIQPIVTNLFNYCLKTMIKI
jgi:hypothetical protein